MKTNQRLIAALLGSKSSLIVPHVLKFFFFDSYSERVVEDMTYECFHMDIFRNWGKSD